MIADYLLALVVVYFAVGWLLFFVTRESRATDTATAGRVAGDILFWPLALFRYIARGRAHPGRRTGDR